MTDDERTEMLPGFEAARDDDAAAAAAAEPGRPEASAHQTIRWGALVWALVFATIAGSTLWVLSSSERRGEFEHFVSGLDPMLGALYVLAAVGVLVALFGVVGLIRRGERARRA